MAANEITIEVKAGPTLMAAIDLIEVVEDSLDLIPEWEAESRRKIKCKLTALADQISAELEQRTKKPGWNRAG